MFNYLQFHCTTINFSSSFFYLFTNNVLYGLHNVRNTSISTEKQMIVIQDLIQFLFQINIFFSCLLSRFILINILAIEIWSCNDLSIYRRLKNVRNFLHWPPSETSCYVEKFVKFILILLLWICFIVFWIKCDCGLCVVFKNEWIKIW